MEVLTAETGEDAIRTINARKVNLLILDIMLPGINGLAVCKEIRKNHKIPIIMLSAKGEESDRIIGLEFGADDYVTKPFSPHEVAIRARILLQRTSVILDEGEPVTSIGNITLLPETLEVQIENDKVQLTPREFRLLKYLADHAGHTKTRDQIINSIWGADFEGEDRIVDTIVKKLRRKLTQDCNADLGIQIITIFGVGYKLEETK